MGLLCHLPTPSLPTHYRWQGPELGREGDTRLEGTWQHKNQMAAGGESLWAALWSERQQKRLAEILREV